MEAYDLKPNASAQEMMQKLIYNISQVILDKEAVVAKLVCTWVAGGHVLLEDVPGTGKTILARSLAKSVQLPFKRMQFTPDLLPSDVVGANIFNRKSQEFQFRPGPLFSTVFLADEINRATPRTQSALLEAMAEKQITVDGDKYELDPLFFVIATANPVEQAGTFPLPEAQLDRFFVRLSLGYPSDEAEMQIVREQYAGHPIDRIEPVLTKENIQQVQQSLSEVEVHDPVLQYVHQIIKATRTHKDLILGASPRATLALIKLTKAFALAFGHGFVTPDHVQAFAPDVLGHRVILSPEARFSGKTSKTVLAEILKSVSVPVGR